MSDVMKRLFETRTQWLSEQVNVEYPTKESLIGRDLYLEKTNVSCFEPITVMEGQDEISDVILPVTFHRMTILFALLQSEQFHDDAQSADVIEFLTQIIYGEPCQLFLAFEHGEAVAAALVTTQENRSLISDVAFKSNSMFSDESAFIAQLAHLVQQSDSSVTEFCYAIHHTCH